MKLVPDLLACGPLSAQGAANTTAQRSESIPMSARGIAGRAIGTCGLEAAGYVARTIMAGALMLLAGTSGAAAWLR